MIKACTICEKEFTHTPLGSGRLPSVCSSKCWVQKQHNDYLRMLALRKERYTILRAKGFDPDEARLAAHSNIRFTAALEKV